MPIGNLDVPVIGKNTVIAVLVQTHILFATFIIGAVLIAATSEYLGVVTKQPQYERFARNLARFVVLLFASGAALAITFVLSLITLFPVFFSYLQNVFFWVFLVEAFMFLGQIIIVYAWYNVWDKLAYRKMVHVTFGLIAGFFGLMAMTMIDAVASYMLTPAEAPVTEVARTFLNQTMIPLNMHRFVGNFSYAGFLIAGWGAFRYLRSTREEDREYYDWMGHWGLIWRFAIVGAGMGLFNSPNQSSIMGSVPNPRLGNASGMISQMRYTGQALGIAVGGAVIASRTPVHVRYLADSLPQSLLERDAFILALHDAFYVAVGICVVGVLASLIRD